MTDRPRARRDRDLGVTLIELILAVSLMGIVLAAASTAVVVLVRNSDSTTTRIGDAQDVRQLVNYFPGDVRSAALHDPSYPGVLPPPGGEIRPSRCDVDEPGVLHLQLRSVDGLIVYEYRTVTSGGSATLLRWRCELPEPESTASTGTQRVRIADRLDPAGPVNVVENDGRIEMTLIHLDGATASLAATPLTVEELPHEPPPEPPPTVPDEGENPDATTCPANPNEFNEGYMVMTAGDVDMKNPSGHSYGPMAVGGDLSFKNYDTSMQSGGEFYAVGDHPTALLVNGMVNWPDSSGGYLNIYNGHLHVGNLANWTPHAGGPSNQLRLSATSGDPQNRQIRVIGTNQTYDSVEQPGLYDFDGAFAKFREIGDDLGKLVGEACENLADLELRGQNGVGEWVSGDLWVYFEPGKATVLTMTAAEYASIGNVNIAGGSATPGKDTPFIINIVDEGVVTMPSGETNISRNHIPYVLWNFPNASQVDTGGTFWGGLLAPNAIVHQNGDIRGNVIAAGLVSNSGIISLQAFEGRFPWPSPG